MARGNQGHVPNPTALKKKPAKHEGRRRRAGGATGRRKRDSDCQSLLTFLTRPSLTRRIASQLLPKRSAGATPPPHATPPPESSRGGRNETPRPLEHRAWRKGLSQCISVDVAPEPLSC